MLSVQSKSPSLAGLLTNVNVLSGQILSNPKVLTGKNLVKLSVLSTPTFTNLGAMAPLSADQNATNIDVSSRLMPLNIPQLQGCTPCRQYPKHFGDSHSAKESAQCGGSEHRLNICPMFECYIAGNPSSKQYRNRDLYGEAGGDVLKSQDIKKRSINKCFGQKLDEKKGSISSATLSTTANGYQPFGSIPRDCNSLRRTRLIHVARDESPSLRISSSSCDRNSCANRNWYWSVLGLSVDIVITNPISSITGCNYNVIACCLQSNKKTMPRSAPTLTGHLTTTDRLIIEEAVIENTTPAQGRHSLNLNSGNEQTSFIWIIAAIRRDCPTIKATIHHIDAPTEREARLSLVKDHVCFFAGRINQAVSHA